MSLIKRDLNHIWHPCSQMKDYETFPPIEIIGAQGAYLNEPNGKNIIDAISSWWCKSLGHNHRRLQQALLTQAKQFEHVILAHTTNKTIVALSEKLSTLTKNLNKILFASDGSCAVEIAIKMSVHARQLCKETKRTKIMALENDYHGETALALATSDCELYRKHYEPLLPKIEFIQALPYVLSKHDPLWTDCKEHWNKIEKQLNSRKEELSAIIIEPILQGASGMKIYSADFLKRLRNWTTQNNVHLIADEILTGLGRTGMPLACDHASIEPDFLCLSKGLTAGVLPMSVTLTSNTIYDLFYDDYEKEKSFLHSHTHSGNTLAAAVALENLKIMEEENLYETIQKNEPFLLSLMQEVGEKTKKLKNIRALGAVVAADLITDKNRMGYEIFKRAVRLGAYLRPLGNTLYWLPPFNTSKETLEELKNITIKAILNAYKK